MTSYSVRTVQARCAALGFWPGPIDGISGKRTRAAEAAARASQKAKGLPFIHPSGLSRIHWHWTGGGHTPNAQDLASYHRLVTGEGEVIEAHDLTRVLSHTLNGNTSAISISACAMLDAVERPFSTGSAPLNMAHVDGIARLTAQFCFVYDIPVSQWSTLSHSEVEPSLGIKQRQKWDINWIPGMEAPADPIRVGNRIRDLVRARLESFA